MEPVKYLLYTYTYNTYYAIYKTAEQSEKICQNTNETENLYPSRIGEAAYLFGNNHVDNEKISTFMKGLLPSACPIVDRLQREQAGYVLTLNPVVAFFVKKAISHPQHLNNKTTFRSVFPKKVQLWIIYIQPVPFAALVQALRKQNA